MKANKKQQFAPYGRPTVFSRSALKDFGCAGRSVNK